MYICMYLQQDVYVCIYVHTYILSVHAFIYLFEFSFFGSLLHASRHLGGKFGKKLTDELGITHMGQLRKFTKVELQRKLGAKQG